MKSSSNPEAELKNAVRDGRVVFVAGTGVSIAATSHPQASWSGLLQSGLEWLTEHKLMDDDIAGAHLKLLKSKAQTHHLISAAEDITTGMGGVTSTHYAEWLEGSVGAIIAKDRSVLDALQALRRHGQGHLLATTNYDSLLLGDPPELNAVTWKETDDLIGAVRDWDTDKVIFLHGYWRKPTSVILDWNSYEQITRGDEYRDDLAAFWKTNTWVYVGCGVTGLSDPDFGLLLERYGERARRAGHLDYCLVCGATQRQEFQAHFDTQEFNIRAVSYGENHSDLPAYLHSLLPAPAAPPRAPSVVPIDNHDPIPTPPSLYAEPDYIGSHQFVGRRAELDAISDWANRSDPTNLLLFEAIGGNGKSMLTWEWATRHATAVRSDWAGRFWYSFYERGAVMEDFCRRALAYMTGRPLKELLKPKTAEMKDELIAQLHSRPWLLILDGLERVLVAYHRIDAAEVPDEEANTPTDKVLNRNPCDTIRDEDNDLLRALAACAPSKILVSSRLTPRVLLNPAGQPIPGARRITLPGLRPPDAEKLLRSCGIDGDSAAIQDYLRQNCDNHPLVIGIVAGLIANYLPDRGNFDTWTADTQGGAALDLAALDLIQRRNHILHAAITALPDASHQLLSTLALLSESVEYTTLEVFNPHLPAEPQEVERPGPPEEHWDWERMTDEGKAKTRMQYHTDLERRKQYDEALRAWSESEEVHTARGKFAETVHDLEQRGLLQYEGRARHYDLHPVVRGVAAGRMKAEDKERFGQRVVDHFSAQPHSPYEKAQSLEDLSSGLHVVRTLLKLGHFQQATEVYRSGLSDALMFNLEAHAETLSMLRPFFPAGWGELPPKVNEWTGLYLANIAGVTLRASDEHEESLHASAAILRGGSAGAALLMVTLGNMRLALADQLMLAKASRVDALVLEIATLINESEALFVSRFIAFIGQTKLGQWQAAKATWDRIVPMGRKWSRSYYRQGDAEYSFAVWQYWQGTLQEEHLAAAASLAARDNNRQILRLCHKLRGTWQLEQSDWPKAAASFKEAVRMARERHCVDAGSETGLALAKSHLGQLSMDDARSEAERLAQVRQPAYRFLGMLCRAVGDPDQAKLHALSAYRRAWADGEPYVHRFELTKATELLEQMNVPIPELPPYDPAKDEPFPWEADVRASIEKLRAEKEASNDPK